MSSSKTTTLEPGWKGVADDWATDKEVFRNVPWGKAMMWIFLLSDTFIFSCFLIASKTVKIMEDFRLPLPRHVCRTCHPITTYFAS